MSSSQNFTDTGKDKITPDDITSIYSASESGYGTGNQNDHQSAHIIETTFSNKAGYATSPVVNLGLNTHTKALASTMVGDKGAFFTLITGNENEPDYQRYKKMIMENVAEKIEIAKTGSVPEATPYNGPSTMVEDPFSLTDDLLTDERYMRKP